MTIETVHNLTNDIINKHQGGYLPAAEFNRHFRSAELMHMDWLTGELRRLQYGRPIPNVGIGMAKKINESLAPFRKVISLDSGQTGEVGKPNNIASTEAMNKPDGTPIVPMHSERLGFRLRSSVINVINNPVYAEYDTYWKVYPEDMGAFVATVIENPPYSNYAVTLDGNGREVYDNANSVDPIWRNGDVVEIIGRMLKTIGVSLKDGELMQYSQSIINQGE